MHCVGVDIIEIERVGRAVARHGPRFLKRVYTEDELAICRGRTPALAVRFSGKEAVMKALGTGARGISWREVEILAEPSGKPYVRLSGKALARAGALSVGEMDISLSHLKDLAIAVVVGEQSGRP